VFLLTAGLTLPSLFEAGIVGILTVLRGTDKLYVCYLYGILALYGTGQYLIIYDRKGPCDGRSSGW
jgi:hypothetical protein